MRITQKEIARQLGVSLISVSRALNGKGYVSKELRKKILDFAEENNYVPHKASQILVRNKLCRIAVFSSSLPHYFWGDVRKGIEMASEQLQHFNYQIKYHTLPEQDTSTYLKILQDEITQGLDAVALVNQRKYDMEKIIAILDKHNLPYVTFNVDAPDSNRLCYIGTDYRAGGKLAANFIGKSLQFKQDACVIVLQLEEHLDFVSPNLQDLNIERLKGFMEVMERDYPEIRVEIESFTTPFLPGPRDDQIEKILKRREGSVDAVYLIPAFNETFLNVLEKLDYKKTITLLHDLDSSALHHLETHLLTGVIYQNPILQGYYTIRTLEHFLESSIQEKQNDIAIINSIILAENRNLFMNHQAITQLMD